MLLCLLSFILLVSATAPCDPTTIEATEVLVSDPNSPDYKLGTQQYASKTVNVVKLQPAVIVYCSSEKEVQNAIQYAARCNLTITTRSGGHSYTGASSCSGCMQIDVSGIDHVNVYGKQVTAGSGVLLGFLDDILGLYFLAIPHGGCRSVAMGGHFQSSAWGHLAVSYGSGMDRVLSFRLVLPNATAITVSSTDANKTLFWSILGSAPGSWGVITEYTLNAIADSEIPHSRMISRTYPYAPDSLLKVLQHSQYIMEEQEKMNTRDFKVLLAIGPDTDSDDKTTQYISVYIIWTGIDSGALSDALYKIFIQPYDDLNPSSYIDIPLPMSIIISIASVEFDNTGYHYHLQSFHSDYWWSDTFLELIVQEITRRMAVPDTFLSFQFLPLGLNSQWTKNAGQNALTWRNVRMYVDDWYMFKDPSQSESIRKEMVAFRESTRKYWQMSDGSDRYTWMSPMTTYPGSTNLRDPKVRKSFFPDDKVFSKLQALKRELDPNGLFADQSHIPL